jgi:site-specific recombinase XerD
VRRDGRSALALAARDFARRNLAAPTIHQVLRTARIFLEGTKKPLARITRADVRAFLALRSRTITATTQALEASALRRFFSLLVRHELLLESPAAEIKVRAGRSLSRPLLSESAIHSLLEAASRGAPVLGEERARAIRLRDRACLELLYGLGLRASEAASLLVLDLRLEEGSLLVRRAKRGGGRFLPLPPSSLPHLERYMTEGRPALTRALGRDEGRFLLSQRGRPLDRLAVFRLVRSAARRSGLAAQPHDLRRALATHLLRSHVSERALQELLGHSSLETTARYLLLDREDLRRAVELLDRRDPDVYSPPREPPCPTSSTTCRRPRSPMKPGAPS